VFFGLTIGIFAEAAGELFRLNKATLLILKMIMKADSKTKSKSSY